MGKLVLVNPRHRHHRRHHYRRNPISISGLTDKVKTASIGAFGALLNNWLSNQLATLTGLGSSVTTGIGGYAFRIVTTLGVGMVLDKVNVVGKNTAQVMTEGALTVTIANMLIYLANTYGGVNLSGVGRVNRNGRTGYLAPAMTASIPSLPGQNNLGRNNVRQMRAGQYTRATGGQANAQMLDGAIGDTGEYMVR